MLFHRTPHADVARLTTEVDRARRTQRQPLEEALATALERGAWEEAEPRAREILSSWPESEAARRALKQLETYRAHTRAAELLAEAEHLARTGEVERARHALRAAKELGASEPEVMTRAEETLRQALETQRRARLQQLTKTFEAVPPTSPLSTEQLLEYLDLDPPSRGALRAQVSRCELDVLEELEPTATKARVRAEQALAVARAERLLVEGHADQALAELARDERLTRSPRAKRVWTAATEQQRELRSRVARERLEAARAAMSSGELGLAARRAGEVDAALLSPADHADLDRIVAAGAAHNQLEAAFARIEEAANSGAWLEARQQTDAILPRLEGAQRDAWTLRRATFREKVREAWKIRVLEGEDARVGLAHIEQPLSGEPERCLMPGGETAVIAAAYDRWLFSIEVDARSLQPRRALELEAPRAFSEHVELHLQLDVLGRPRLAVLDERQALIVSPEDGEIEAWHDLRPLLSEGCTLEGALLLPGHRFLCVQTYWGKRGTIGRSELSLLDLERKRTHRNLGDDKHCPKPLASDQEACCMVVDMKGGATTYSALGAVVESSFPTPNIQTLLADPSGPGYIIVTNDADDPDNGPITLRRPSTGAELELSDFAGAQQHMVGAPRDQGWMAVLAPAPDEAAIAEDASKALELYVVRVDEHALRIEARFPVPALSWLVTDPESRSLLVAATTDQGLQVSGFGPGQPPLLRGTPIQWGFLSAGAGLWQCPSDLPETEAEVDRMTEVLRGLPAPERVRTVRAWVETRPPLPETCAARIAALGRRFDHGIEHKALIEAALGWYPSEARIALLAAQSAATQGRWTRVEAILEPLRDHAASSGVPEHFHHLLGLARQMLGRSADARASFQASSARGSACYGAGWDWLIQWLEDPVAAEARAPGVAALDPERFQHARTTARLAHAVRRAQEALRDGRPDEALEILDAPSVWVVAETRSMATRAEAYLAVDTTTAAQSWKKAYALARFLASRRTRALSFGNELPLAAAPGEPERMEALERAARAWLRDRSRPAP